MQINRMGTCEMHLKWFLHKSQVSGESLSVWVVTEKQRWWSRYQIKLKCHNRACWICLWRHRHYIYIVLHMQATQKGRMCGASAFKLFEHVVAIANELSKNQTPPHQIHRSSGTEAKYIVYGTELWNRRCRYKICARTTKRCNEMHYKQTHTHSRMHCAQLGAFQWWQRKSHRKLPSICSDFINL